MKINDILAEGEQYGDRFVRWLHFICVAEAKLDSKGNIVAENLNDGAGITFCGLTQRDDGLPSNPSPDWIAQTYRASYWNKVNGDHLSGGVGEETANICVNEGLRTAGKILQESSNSLGAHLCVDGLIGAGTIAASTSQDAHDLCLKIAAYNDEHYKEIAAMNPNDRRFLRGWINRDAAMVQEFCPPA